MSIQERSNSPLYALSLYIMWNPGTQASVGTWTMCCRPCTSWGSRLLFTALDLVTSMKCISLSSPSAANCVPFKVRRRFYLNQALTAWTEINWMEWNIHNLGLCWRMIEICCCFWFTLMRPMSFLSGSNKNSSFVRIVFFVQFNEGLHCIVGHECLPHLQCV